LLTNFATTLKLLGKNVKIMHRVEESCLLFYWNVIDNKNVMPFYLWNTFSQPKHNNNNKM